MEEIEIGAPIRWRPSAFCEANGAGRFADLGAVREVSGRIVYVNAAHRFYRAEASFPGGVIRECFKY